MPQETLVKRVLLATLTYINGKMASRPTKDQVTWLHLQPGIVAPWCEQARDQLETPGEAKGLLRGPNILKLCPTYFSRGAKKFFTQVTGLGVKPVEIPGVAENYEVFWDFLQLLLPRTSREGNQMWNTSISAMASFLQLWLFYRPQKMVCFVNFYLMNSIGWELLRFSVTFFSVLKMLQKNSLCLLKSSAYDFIQNCWTNIKLQNPEAFSWIYHSEKLTENERNTAICFTCNYLTSKKKVFAFTVNNLSRALRLFSGLDILKLDKKSTDVQCFIIQFGQDWSFAWGLSHQKPPVATGVRVTTPRLSSYDATTSAMIKTTETSKTRRSIVVVWWRNS